MTASYHPPAPIPPTTDAQKSELLPWIQSTPLVYGPWQDFKSGFKNAENAFLNGVRDVDTFGALLARIDTEPLPGHRKAVKGLAAPAWAGSVWSMMQVGDLVYVSTPDGLRILESNSPLTPTQLPLETKVDLRDGVVVGDRFCTPNGVVYDISNPRQPTVISQGSLYSQGVAGLGQEHVVIWAWNGLGVYQLPGQNGAITRVGQLDGNFNTCVISGTRAVAQYSPPQRWNQQKLHVIDLSNPQNPLLGAEVGERDERPLALNGSILTTYKGMELRTWDISEAKPRKLATLQVPNLHQLRIFDDLGLAFIYHYDYRQGTTENLVFLDLTRPHDPRKIGEVASGSNRHAVRLGNILWLGGNEGIYVLDITDPARAQFIGQKPSAGTFGYLKRRGRRLLRALAESDASAYVTLATQMLRRGARAGSVDFDFQWMEADILVGAGHHFRQARHGRGPVLRQPKYWRKQRLERAPEAWDQRLDLVRELASDDALAWQTGVVMRRVLAANNQPLPRRSAAALESALWADWPFAAVEAAREAEPRAAELSPRAAAALLWNINPRRRRTVLEQLGYKDVPFSPQIGSHLAALLGREVASHTDRSGGSLSRRQTPQAGLSRRGREVALLLAARCDLSHPQFDASMAIEAIPALLGSNEAPLRNLGIDLSRRLKPEQALDLTALLPRIPSQSREAFIEALCLSASRGRFTDQEVLAAKIRHGDAEVRSAAWRVIAASKTRDSITKNLWTGVLRGVQLNYDYTARTYHWQISSFLESALNTPAALALLAKCGAHAGEIMRFGARFWQPPAAPPHLFTAYAMFIPARDTIQAISAASDAVWAGWKPVWLRTISGQPKLLAEFWKTVQSTLQNRTLPEPDLERMRSRTFQDSDVAATFAGAAGTLPPELLLQLIGAVSETVWNLWRGPLLETLRNDAATRSAFWNAVRTSGLDNELLRSRLVDDSEYAATFGMLDADTLDFDDPALEALIMNWLEARRDTMNEDELARAGVHALPGIRAWGLNLLGSRGMSVPLALRLHESGLRDPREAAQHWFRSEDERRFRSGDGHPLELIMALCDSPNPETRAFGREFLAEQLSGVDLASTGEGVKSLTRLDYALSQGLMEQLEETPNPEMQSYVAELLLKRNTEGTPDPVQFDRAVLRGRYRARKAKSLVQERRAKSAPLPDDRTLLELARGRTPRDADWAWTQLAKRAQEGAVDGVEVSGTGAI